MIVQKEYLMVKIYTQICCLLLWGLVFTTLPVAAQETTLEEFYLAFDESFQFYYPTDWEVNDEDPAFVVLSGQIDNSPIAMTLFAPSTIEVFGLVADSALEFAQEIAYSREFIIDDAEAIIIGEREAAIASVDLNKQPGVAFIIRMSDGGFGLVIVLADEVVLAQKTRLIASIVLSYDTPGGAEEEVPPVLTLQDFDQGWEAATNELAELELIPQGGELLFEVRRAFFDGLGAWFTPLGSDQARPDVVMAGQLHFISDSQEIESCGLLARIPDTGNNAVNVFLEVGISNIPDVYYVDRSSNAEEIPAYQTLLVDLDLSIPHHILLIAVDETLTIFLDGTLVFEQIPIEDRVGYYGLTLLGKGANSRCEGTGIWVYQIPSFTPDICEVSSSLVVNKRSGPSTGFERVGTLNNEAPTLVIGQSIGADGFIWWQLEDEAWVREDVVNEAGDCFSVRHIQPE